MDIKEADWLREIQTGNLRAFDSLFKRFYSPLCLYALDIVKNKSIAEEIVQDIFLKFWNNRETIQIRISLRSYLYRMVHNYSLNYIRNNFPTDQRLEVSLDELQRRCNILDIESSANVLDEIINQQMETELAKAIESLSPQCREIFYMARYQLMSYSEIATKLEISVSTVKSQMLRSIEKLKTTLNFYLK